MTVCVVFLSLRIITTVVQLISETDLKGESKDRFTSTITSCEVSLDL